MQDGPEIMTLAPKAALSYFHTAAAGLSYAPCALEVWNLITTQRQPLMRLSFRIRDAVSALFGVRRIGGFSGLRRDTVAVGDYLDFFLVERAEPGILALTARDRHLDVMTVISVNGCEVAITTSVITHNIFGRAYMIPVGIAHRFIVAGMLRRLQRQGAA